MEIYYFLENSLLVYSTSWKFSLHIVYIFKKAWNFLTKFCYSDQIFTSLCIKLETSEHEHAHLTITLSYILFANILTKYQLETYIEDTL